MLISNNPVLIAIKMAATMQSNAICEVGHHSFSFAAEAADTIMLMAMFIIGWALFYPTCRFGNRVVEFFRPRATVSCGGVRARSKPELFNGAAKGLFDAGDADGPECVWHS